MDHLRDGIGLRGYGQRDPKKEYKREGYDLFVQTLQSTKASVVDKMFHVQRLTEREVAEAEAQRRRQVEARQQAISAQHPGQADEQPAAQQPQAAQRVTIAARHSAAAQQAALVAQARRLAMMQQAQGRAPGPQQQAGAQPGGAGAAPAGVPAAMRAPVQQVPRAAVRRDAPKIGRNDPCHCGSGKKYKNCHMKTDQSVQNG
jgi:preprotein translocase subunit SecA